MIRTQEVIDYEKEFDEAHMEIVAVTGALGFGGGKVPQAEYWTASIQLTAWRLDGDRTIYTGTCRLVTKADDAYLTKLRECAKANTIIKAKVRQKEDQFLLIDLPVVVEDSMLQPILEVQMKPVDYEDRVLGTFALDKRVDTFEKKVDWQGRSVNLTFDNGTDEEIAEGLRTCYEIMNNVSEWDNKVRKFAAEQLLELKNENWIDEDEDELTKEEFMTRISVRSISAMPEGEMEFWLDDGDIFWGHSIVVSGSVDGGLEDAEMCG